MYFLGCFLIAALGIAGTSAQSVAQQCLTEQIRNGNLNNNQNNAPEAITMAAFDAICRNYDNYVGCFETRLPASNNPADRFLRLVFSANNMRIAYNGLCELDLENLRQSIRCLLSTPEVRRCYNVFNQGVNQVINLENQNQLPLATLEDIACNVSIARYRCETAVYSFCDAEAGQIMQDFFFAGIPDDCRRLNRVRSRYIDLFSGGVSFVSQANLAVMVAMLMMLTLFRFS